MTEGELLTAIQTRIRTFSGVHDDSIRILPQGSTANVIEKAIFPAFIITPISAVADPQWGEEPGFEKLIFTITICQRILNDAYGESLLVGTSQFSGLIALTQTLKNSLRQLGSDEGIVVQCLYARDNEPFTLNNTNYVGTREVGFEAYISS